MGCAQSRIENEESVMRCKLRRQHMGEAVTARNAFAAAHSQYTMALKNTGAALSDFGQGESLHQPDHQSQIPALASSSSASTSVVQPPMESLPPPPPLPEFSPSPLKRASSMPEIPKKVYEHSKAHDPTIAEDDGEEIEEVEEIKQEPQPQPQPQPRREERRENKAPVESTPEPPPPPPPDSAWDYFFSNYEGMQGGSLHNEEIQEPMTPQKGVLDEPLPPPPPEPETPPMMTPPMGMTPPMMTPEGLPPRPEKKKNKQGVNVHHQHAVSASAVETRKGKMVERNGAMEKRTVSLLQLLTVLDDHFLRASESAHEVSKMLEANRMHYHSNFADNRGA